MKQEWLDIVDANDNVVGRDTRAKVHAEGKLHRSTHILLFNSSGEVFVQLRSMSKDVGAGLWDTSAAGHVNSGESYVECAVRELQEELGIRLQSSELEQIDKLHPQAVTGFEFTHVYKAVSDKPLVLQAEEIDDGRWVTPGELSNWISTHPEQFTDVFKLIWSDCDKTLSNK